MYFTDGGKARRKEQKWRSMANSRERLKQKEGEKAFKKRRKMEQRETREKKSNIKKDGKEGGGSDKGRK